MRCNVAKSRTGFYFVQCFLQQKRCVILGLRGMLHLAISLATCVATKLPDKLHNSVTAPLANYSKHGLVFIGLSSFMTIIFGMAQR